MLCFPRSFVLLLSLSQVSLRLGGSAMPCWLRLLLLGGPDARGRDVVGDIMVQGLLKGELFALFPRSVHWWLHSCVHMCS